MTDNWIPITAVVIDAAAETLVLDVLRSGEA